MSGREFELQLSANALDVEPVMTAVRSDGEHYPMVHAYVSLKRTDGGELRPHLDFVGLMTFPYTDEAQAVARRMKEALIRELSPVFKGLLVRMEENEPYQRFVDMGERLSPHHMLVPEVEVNDNSGSQTPGWESDLVPEF